MDEGRLAVVFRQEEQHRKFVYMMNDIVRARLGLYNNCLAREQHESSVKLLKNCSEVRRSIVRQNVLKKCLEMRKRKILTRDPSKQFGQYGGKPLWAMSRDIDRVIADNHPKIRRMKHVEEVMRQSLESGAILDEEAVTRRMEAFFQLKRAKQLKDKSPGRVQDGPKGSGLPPRRNFFKPPSWAVHSSDSVLQAGPPSSTQPASTNLRKTSDLLKHDLEATQKESRRREKPSSIIKPTNEQPGKENHQKNSELLDVINNVSLNVDSKGRLQGIGTISEDASNEEGMEVQHGKSGNLPSVARTVDRSPTGGRRTQQADVLSIRGGSGSEGEDKKKQQQHRDGQDSASARPRSKLILPPIESTKALVSRQ